MLYDLVNDMSLRYFGTDSTIYRLGQIGKQMYVLMYGGKLSHIDRWMCRSTLLRNCRKENVLVMKCLKMHRKCIRIQLSLVRTALLCRSMKIGWARWWRSICRSTIGTYWSCWDKWVFLKDGHKEHLTSW